MKTITEIVNQLRADANVEIPDLIISAGLPEIKIFEIGQSRDDTQNSFFVCAGKSNHDAIENRLEMTCQLQLLSVTEDDINSYRDIMKVWFENYDYSKFGMEILNGISIDPWPNFKSRTSFIYFDLSLTENKDSCD